MIPRTGWEIVAASRKSAADIGPSPGSDLNSYAEYFKGRAAPRPKCA